MNLSAREYLQMLALGGLGMWICGAFVYEAAFSTSSANIALIYAVTPVDVGATIYVDMAFYLEVTEYLTILAGRSECEVCTSTQTEKIIAVTEGFPALPAKSVFIK